MIPIYLSNGKFREFLSKTLRIICDVPHGSIPAASLFLIYVYDMLIAEWYKLFLYTGNTEVILLKMLENN